MFPSLIACTALACFVAFSLARKAGYAIHRRTRISRMRRRFRAEYTAWKCHGDIVAKLSLEETSRSLREMNA